MPKSVTTAVPPESSTLSGLMSRCTMPRSCAYASARVTSRRMLMVSPGESGPRSRSRARRLSPSTNGIVKYKTPFVSPAFSTGTILACCSDAATLISRSNRSALRPAASSVERTLTTTRRPSRRSSATKTRDMPPPPSSWSRVYAPPKFDWRSSRSVIADGGERGVCRRPGPKQCTDCADVELPPRLSDAALCRSASGPRRHCSHASANDTAASAWIAVVSNVGVLVSPGLTTSGISVHPRIAPSAPRWASAAMMSR